MENTTSEILTLAFRMGRMLLENGGEITRVQEIMERIAFHYGDTDHNFVIMTNAIFVSGDSFSKMETIPIKGARLDKVIAVNQLAKRIVAENMSIEEANRCANEIRDQKGYALRHQVVAAFLGCIGFCAIFGGSIIDCLASAVSGSIMFFFVSVFALLFYSKPLSNIGGGILATFLCVIFHKIGFGAHLGNMIVGSLVPLIPGAAFTNGLRDIASENYLSGITRMIDALMVFFCIALGVGIAFVTECVLSHSMIQMVKPITDQITAHIPWQLLAAFLGTAAFSVLFGVPKQYYHVVGIVGMFGWFIYLLSTYYTPLDSVGGTFLATVCVASLSHFFAVKLKCPNIVFLICGIFPLIPGGGVFWSSYYLVPEQIPLALNAGYTAVKVTIAIVLGIMVASLFYKKAIKNFFNNLKALTLRK